VGGGLLFLPANTVVGVAAATAGVRIKAEY